MASFLLRCAGCPWLLGASVWMLLVWRVPPASAVTPEPLTLSQKLVQLDSLRDHDKTPFDEAMRRADALAEEYPDPRDRGHIYYTLAGVFVGSRARSKQAVEIGHKALTFPLDPLDKSRVYLYLGSAIQLTEGVVSGEQLATLRREAALPYLQCIEELDNTPLPRLIPKPPPAPGTLHPQVQRRLVRDGDRLPDESWERWHLRTELESDRKTAVECLARMYSKLPFATEELRALATRTITNKQSVDRIMSAVDLAVRERLLKEGTVVLDTAPLARMDLQPTTFPALVSAAKPPARQGTSGRLIPWIVGIALAAAAVGAWLAFRRRASRR